MLTETEEQLKFYWHPAKTIDRSFRQESFVPESGAMAFESGPRLTPSAHSSSRRGRRGNNGEISEKCETWLESACHPDSRCHEPASRELSAHRVHGTTMHVHRPSLRSEYRPRASSTSASSILRSLTSISAHGIAISDFRSSSACACPSRVWSLLSTLLRFTNTLSSKFMYLLIDDADIYECG